MSLAASLFRPGKLAMTTSKTSPAAEFRRASCRRIRRPFLLLCLLTAVHLLELYRRERGDPYFIHSAIQHGLGRAPFLCGLGRPLRRIIEECFLGDAVTVPALVRKLFHMGVGAVQPNEIKNPSDDDVVAAHETGTDTRRLHGSRLREDRALARHQQVP